MSAPIAWDYDTAVGFVRKALEDIGGKYGLIFDVRIEHVLADASLNYRTVRWWVEHQAYEDRECWEAIKLFYSRKWDSMSIVDIERSIHLEFGDRPKGRKGRNSYDRMLRNQFIFDCCEILQVAGDMKREDAIEILSEVLREGEYAIDKARQAYICMMDRDPYLWPRLCREINSDLWYFGYWKKYSYIYARLSLPEPAGVPA